MRHVATSLLLCIALISGVVLALFWDQPALRSLSIQAVPSSDVEETALAFYRAVNTYLESGDDIPLRQILHPDFVDHDSGSSVNGNAEAYLQQLDSIRALFPGIQLEPTVEYLGNNAASVSLSLSDRQRREFAGIGIDPVEVVGRLDLLRVERRLVVERWSSAPLAGELDAFPPLALELPVALDNLITRVQQMPVDGSAEPIVDQFWHLLLIVRSGEMQLDVMETAAIAAVHWTVDDGQIAGPVPIEPGVTVMLDRMEAVFLPAGTRFRLWDSSARMATLIALEFGPPVSGEVSPRAPHLLDDLQETLWSGISLSGVGKRLNLSFGHATLRSQATLTNQEVEGAELIWVSGGAIEMAASSGTVRMRDASGVRSQPSEGVALLNGGDAGAAGPGSDIAYRVTGSAPASAWFFSIVPDSVDTSEHEAGGPTRTPTIPPPRTAS
jgi:hypothetical protein